MRRYFFSMERQPLVGQGLPMIEASCSHSVRKVAYLTIKGANNS
jgi:hypothetical protein